MTPCDLPEWRLLVAAARADPADDTRRGACADWLQERGEDERAEFVRVGVEIGKIQRLVATEGQRAGPSASFINGLAERELHLFRAYAPRWLNWLPGKWRGTHPDMRITSADGMEYRVARGFLEAVTCPGEAWLAHGDALYAREPVAAVTLTTDLDWYTRRGRNVVYLTGGYECKRVTADEAYTAAMGITDVLAAEWPGVAFTLPAGVEAVPTADPLRYDFAPRPAGGRT